MRWLPLTLPLFLVGCGERPMSLAEQQEAVRLSVETARMDAATDDVVHVTTSFTLGQAASEAAQELRDWWESQASCASLTLEDSTLTVDFGTSGECTWNGRSWTGTATVTITHSDEDDAVVRHQWEDLSNGIGVLNGEATVTWSSDVGSRRVRTDASWRGQRTLQVTSDRRIERLQPGGPPGSGIVIEGSREWTIDGSEPWTMEINNVEIRPQDPAPQAGSYVITSPSERDLTLSFQRLDENTVRITAEGRRVRVWEVTRDGIEEV
ncbi:MAG: hypothetical protein EA397_07040 [Deltaproteobacteria bacterium]|nr:MAG: hypothetical protein EA397_07040 [Deltaproteobacteria bacterium]